MWVQSVQDGQQAIDYLEGKGAFSDRALHPMPDLVLLDLKMEIGDGFEFLSWRQQHTQYTNVPVVLFTGSQYQQDIRRALKMGATAYVEKPLTFKALLSTVGEIAELARNLHSMR